MLILEKVDSKYLKDIYKDMCAQFPQSELKSFDSFAKMLSQKDSSYQLLIAKDEKNPVGYCLLYFDNEQNTIWIDYIAIYKEFHSHGYGGKLLDAIKNTYKDFLGIYLEVEKANENDINTLRRIRFYTGLGAKKIDCRYFYPNQEGALEMDLYFLPIKGILPEAEKIRFAVENVFLSLHKELPHIKEVLDRIKI